MKKLILLLLIFIPFLLCGCTYDMSRKEIDEIDLVLVLGIDYTDGQYSLSAIYSSGSGAGGGGGGQDKGSKDSSEQVANGKGKTVFEALVNLKMNNKKNISLAQAGSFLIGEDAAKQGLKKCLDFLSRDETIKMESLIYVTKGTSAADFIKASQENKKTIHDDLDAMKQKQQEMLKRNDNTTVNILNDMQQTYSSVLIPYIIANESGYLIEGFAVFDQLALKDYLDYETSVGVNYFRNIIRTYPINLDNQVGLQVTYTKTKLKANIKNNQITVKVKVSFETMIKEVLTDYDIFTVDALNNLTNKQNDHIKSILEKAADYSKNNGLDILNLARVVENQNVSKWSTVEGSWNENISNINYEYELQSRISKSFIVGVK